jgi:hypothetical protein
MNLELTDEEEAVLERELRRIIADDRYPLSSRIRTLKAILNKIRPEPERAPPPPPQLCPRIASCPRIAQLLHLRFSVKRALHMRA